ncbi:MAG: Fe-S cluster assembly protein SufD [Bacteroidota bacterium]|nr:Fe-S cluster assembly protein SufD [Bacteroidota bacterium]
MKLIAKLLDVKEELVELYQNNFDLLRQGSSEIINRFRDEAIEQFRKKGIPNRKNEEYKYTVLEPHFQKDYKYHFKPKKITFAIDDIFKCDVPELETKNLLLLNGWFLSEKEQLQEFKNGVILGSLAEAAKKYPVLVEKYYGKHAKTSIDNLVALNTAYAQDGIFIYVPKGVVLDFDIQIINILLDDENLMVQPRNLFIMEENSEARLIICDHSLSEREFLTNSVTEIVANANARLDIVKMQNEHNLTTQLSSTFISQKRNSNVSTNIISLHGGMIRNNIHVVLEEEGCESSTYGLYLVDKKQHVSNHAIVEHISSNCTSKQKFKGVIDDKASGAFNGKILVHPNAQKTNAFQTNNNILLTDDAEMNTKPQLEIYADDVKCSHGATVGQLDDDAMFYLRARGIGEREARLMLMYAFTFEIINEIKVLPLRDRINELVDKRLRGELSRCNNCAMNCQKD